LTAFGIAFATLALRRLRHDSHPEGRLMATDKNKAVDRNEDPITGAPGAHPVGVGIGAAGGGAAGAAIGAAAGPVGAAVGAVAGAVAGGYAGKAVGEAIDPTAEEAYWSENYNSRPYVEAGRSYSDYQPAYRYGWESYGRHGGRNWDEIEADLQRGWDQARGESSITWDQARPATRDAWDRLARTMDHHRLP
jgi:hypothetical protein